MDKLNNNERFKVASTLPELNEKLTINIETENPKKVYWHIKFNLELKKNSINEESMTVVDMEGNVLKTDCIYDEKRSLIIVSPLENYKKDKYYILSIKANIVSKSGRKLKSPINIMFKLK